MSEIRYPTREEVAYNITEETKLVCNMAATLLSNSNGGWTLSTAVQGAYDILLSVLKIQDEGTTFRMQTEYKRRRYGG